MLFAYRALMAFTAISGLGVQATAMILYGYARHRQPQATQPARLSPTAAFIGMAGGVATLIYAASFRIHDLVVERPFNLGDVLGAPPVLLFTLAGLLLIRDVGKAVGKRDMENELKVEQPC